MILALSPLRGDVQTTKDEVGRVLKAPPYLGLRWASPPAPYTPTAYRLWVVMLGREEPFTEHIL